MTDRDAFLVANRRLVDAFVRRRLPCSVRRAFGGAALLQADLWPAYVMAVDGWLASRRPCALSTWVFRALLRETWRALPPTHFIYCPRDLPGDGAALRRRKALVRGAAVRRFSELDARALDVALARDARRDAEERQDATERVSALLPGLTRRRREVIVLRFGIGGQVPLSLDAVGKRLAVTRERVRILEASALRKMEFRAAQQQHHCPCPG